MGAMQGGWISASNAKRIMSKGRGKEEFGLTFYGYARELAAARLGYDIRADISGLSAVEWGLENEWSAVEAYKERELVPVEYPVPFQVHPDYPDTVGCTPDGLVGANGLIEVKCPSSSNHLDNLLDNKQLPDYFDQMQFQLWVTGRDWCDWISFDPRAPEAMQLHVYRVERNQEYIGELITRVEYLEQCVQEQMKLIQEKLK
jgi:hypothetical protein